MRSVEHVKRFTTIGTGSDQGKTAGINETAIIATSWASRSTPSA